MNRTQGCVPLDWVHVDMQCGVGSCVTEFPILFCMHVLSCTRCQGCKLAIRIKLDYPSLSYSILNYSISYDMILILWVQLKIEYVVQSMEYIQYTNI